MAKGYRTFVMKASFFIWWEAIQGGRRAEKQAKKRGDHGSPQTVHREVLAKPYKLICLRSSSVSRARACSLSGPAPSTCTGLSGL